MQKITTLSMVLRPSKPLEMTPARTGSLGPYLQGALLENVDSQYAGLLHQLPFNPYSQHCFLDGGGAVVWRVSALTDEAARQLIEPLRALEQVHLRAMDMSFDVMSSMLETIDIKSLLDSIYEEGPSKVNLQFVTPTSFKSRGAYAIMPTPRLIFQNLLMHYSQAYEGSKEVDIETLDFIEQNVRVCAYNLQSRYFDHVAPHGKKIPAFAGTMTLSVAGPASMAGLARMLLKFGTYAGIGIKTSMGMGGFTYAPVQSKASERGMAR